MTLQRYSAVVFSFILVFSTVTAVAPATAAATAHEPGVSVTLEQSSNTDDVVTVTADFEVPTGVDQFYIYLAKRDSVNVLDDETDGFSRDEYRENPNMVRYEMTTTNSPTLTLEIDVSEQNRGNAFLELGATDEWVLGHSPYMEAVWHDGNQWQYEQVFGGDWGEQEVSASPNGYVGESIFYLGDYTVKTHQEAGQQFRLLIPPEASLSESPTEILDVVGDAATEYTVNSRDPSVTMIAKPTGSGGGFSYYGSNETVVHHESRVDTAGNVWVHEYLHTRQDYRTSSEMSWIREGSAEYHTAKLTYLSGRISASEVERSVTVDGETSDDILIDRSSWDSVHTQYNKGAAVMAALDAKIYDTTNGEKSLVDVTRKLNEHDGKITYPVFKETVNEVAGEDLGPWLDKHVRTDAEPDTSEWKETITEYESPDEDESTEEQQPRTLLTDTRADQLQTGFWESWSVSDRVVAATGG